MPRIHFRAVRAGVCPTGYSAKWGARLRTPVQSFLEGIPRSHASIVLRAQPCTYTPHCIRRTGLGNNSFASIHWTGRAEAQRFGHLVRCQGWDGFGDPLCKTAVPPLHRVGSDGRESIGRERVCNPAKLDALVTDEDQML